MSLLMAEGVSPFERAAAEKFPCSVAQMKANICE
jgi:hypothetical protein